MFVHVTGKEVYQNLSISDSARFDRFISNFRPEDSIPPLVNICVLCGIYPEASARTIRLGDVDFPFNKFIQIRFAKELLPSSVFEKLMAPEFFERPIFFRQQLLYLIKKLLLFGKPDGSIQPIANPKDWHPLGRMCLEIANFLDPPRPRTASFSATSNERLRNDLIARLSPGYELLHPPTFQRGVARSQAILEIVEQLHPEFCDGKSLTTYFYTRTGLQLVTFIELTMAVYSHFLQVTESDDLLNDIPTKFRLDRSTYFQLLGIPEEEMDAYFSLLCRNLEELKDEVLIDSINESYPHSNFTTFRKFPLLYLSESLFTCIDIGFLLEKVSFGFFRTIHNALPDEGGDSQQKDKMLANRLSSYWGEAVETYVNSVLERTPGFYSNVQFRSGRGNDQQIDGIIHEGNSVAILEVKAQYLSAAAKYGETQPLLDELNSKFGLKQRKNGKGSRGAVQQLLCDIETLFPSHPAVQSHFAFSCPRDFLESTDIYPVLIIDDTYLTCPLIQWRLTTWFSEGLKTKNVSNAITVHPLLIISLDFLDEIEPLLRSGEISFSEFCRSWKDRVAGGLQFWEYDSWTSLMIFLKSKGLERSRNIRIQSAFDKFMDRLMDRLKP